MSKLSPFGALSRFFGPCPPACNHSSCVMGALKGARNGAVYGAKIRFPHALVMTLLFKRDLSRPDRMLKGILRATYQHSRNLATFVIIYKSLRCFLRRASGGIDHPIHSFIAGFVGGYYVFGREQNAINQQIVMYLFSRVSWGLVRSGIDRGAVPYHPYGYSMFAALAWAFVLTQFEYEKQTLQKSLSDSMVYIYHDSDSGFELSDFLW